MEKIVDISTLFVSLNLCSRSRYCFLFVLKEQSFEIRSSYSPTFVMKLCNNNTLKIPMTNEQLVKTGSSLSYCYLKKRNCTKQVGNVETKYLDTNRS